MKELSLHILDIAQNSITAESKHLSVTLEENGIGLLTITVSDDGCGMSPGFLETVTDPFTTTRTTRKVGLGLPLLRMSAEQTGGTLQVDSVLGAGTTVTATFYSSHIDCPPVGDIASTVALLTQGAPHVELTYLHTTPNGRFFFSTREVLEMLGPDVPLSEPTVTLWIQEYIKENETLL
jgi:hypothetical protein